MFQLTKKDSNTKARTGIITTAHGDVHTPAFLPIGTKGVVKAISPVPGGVGAMTVASLFENLVEAYLSRSTQR